VGSEGFDKEIRAFSALGLQEMAAYCLKDRKTQIDLQTPALRQKSLGADPLCRSKVVLGLLASRDHTLRNENETVNSGIEEVPSPFELARRRRCEQFATSVQVRIAVTL